ncbi:MAG: ATP-binding protein [Desulfobacteraceae bacterium]
MNDKSTQIPYDLFTLSFTGEWEHLEPLYIEYHFNESLTRIRVAVLVALAFYLVFAILDAILVPDQKIIFWYIRFGVVCPIALWVLWFSFRPGFKKYNQHSLFFMCLVGGAGIVLMVILANPPATYSYYAGIILIFITIYTFIRMRFLWAVSCSWLIFLCYEIGAVWFAGTPDIMLINNNFFFVSANVLCMLAGYSIEINSRSRFLSGYRLKQAKDELAAINQELDLRVKERTQELMTANVSLNKEIQERIHSEKTRIRMEKELSRKQKLEAIGTLAGGIAHDFNNILSAVIGFSELTLQSLDKTSKEHAHISAILKAGSRAAELVRQIMTFSRQTEQEVKPIKLGQIVKEALKLIRATIPAGIEIIQVIESSSTIIADESQLHRIVMNLCTNAYHAMEEEKGTIEVRVENKIIDQGFTQIAEPVVPGEYVSLTISDTGCGMTPEVMEKIFDPFFTTKSADHGTGMGLSVVHGIVKQYNGNIHVYSEPGQGTTFAILLPVSRRGRAEDAVQLAEMPRGSETVMVVDDEGTLVNIMQQNLESLGYTVKGFSDSVAAVDYFSDHYAEFDLIVTDYSMPKMTGIELSEKMLDIRKDIPIILCTGYGKNITRQKIRSKGIRALLMKPLTRHSISTALREILDDRNESVQPPGEKKSLE